MVNGKIFSVINSNLEQLQVSEIYWQLLELKMGGSHAHQGTAVLVILLLFLFISHVFSQCKSSYSSLLKAPFPRIYIIL